MTHPLPSPPARLAEPLEADLPAGFPLGDIFRQIAESIPQLIWIARPDGFHEYYNEPWYEYTGLSHDETAGEGWQNAFHPEDLPEAGRRWAHSLRTGEPYRVEYRCRRHDGVWRWFLGLARPLRDESGRIIRWFGTCTDIDDQRRAADTMHLLDRAGALLSASPMDYEATLASLTRLTVPWLADWCAIEIAHDDGSTRQVGVAHVDPGKVRYAEELRMRYPPRPEDPSGVLSVIRTGQPVLLPEIPDSLLVAGTRDAEHLRIARELGLRSALVLPLTARGRTLGALTLVTAESGRRFSRADLPLAEQLAARAALALDNARLFQDARRLEERFRSLVTASAQAVWVTQPDGRVVEDSPSWRAFTGQTYEQWRGHGWLDAVHPEDREMAARAWNAAVTECKPYAVEYRLRRPDGSYSPTRVRGVPVLNADGSVREWVGTNTDISVQRRAEESARRLDREKAARRLEALRAEVSSALSREGTVPDILQLCAEALAKHLGALTARLWLHVRDTDLLDLAANAGLAAPPRERWGRFSFQQGLPGLVARTREQVCVDRVDEDPRVLDATWVREMGIRAFSGIPLLVRDELVGVLGLYGRQPLSEDAMAALAAVADAIAQGVERRRAEESLQQHAQELARSNEELQQFAYVASHDLQEPLRMVASYTQLLGRRYKGRLDADADEFIRYAVDGVNRMQRLIQDLLAYSRVGTRGRQLKPCDAERALERATANLDAAIQETRATVLKKGPLPPVLADETQLAQVFQNLIGNALKFHGDAPPHVEVTGEPRGAEVRFAVKDRGIGIDPQYFDRIFIIFQRLHGKEEYPGTGIGLAICKKIVERHGGRIGLESQQGQGTTFWFTLPAASPAPGAETP